MAISKIKIPIAILIELSPRKGVQASVVSRLTGLGTKVSSVTDASGHWPLA